MTITHVTNLVSTKISKLANTVHVHVYTVLPQIAYAITINLEHRVHVHANTK